MTALRKRMIECLQLRGLSARPQEMYVRAVRQRAEHSHKAPDVSTAAELRQSFLDIKHVQQYSRRARTIALCGLTFGFEQTLHSDWTIRRLMRAPREYKLPVILSFAEVRRLLGCVRRPRDRVCRSTLDACGLRLPEGTHRHVPDIDSARRLIHVRRGQGGKERDGPWPPRTLAQLRQSWITPRHPVLIFPAPGRGAPGLSTATAPMPRSSVQGACREALPDRGLHTHAAVPTRRHAWATHVLEAGVKLRRRHASLGHRSPTTTRVDTHLTASAEHLGVEAIHRLRGER